MQGFEGGGRSYGVAWGPRRQAGTTATGHCWGPVGYKQELPPTVHGSIVSPRSVRPANATREIRLQSDASHPAAHRGVLSAESEQADRPLGLTALRRPSRAALLLLAGLAEAALAAKRGVTALQLHACALQPGQVVRRGGPPQEPAIPPLKFSQGHGCAGNRQGDSQRVAGHGAADIRDREGGHLQRDAHERGAQAAGSGWQRVQRALEAGGSCCGGTNGRVWSPARAGSMPLLLARRLTLLAGVRAMPPL